jgi:hypothetical protein
VLVAVGTTDGVFQIDLETEEIVDIDARAILDPELRA